MSTRYHRHKNVSELKDFLMFMVLSAPDNFPEWRNLDLGKAFERLNEGLDNCAAEIGDAEKLQRIRQMVADSHKAYLKGDLIKGAHLLQDVAQLLK